MTVTHTNLSPRLLSLLAACILFLTGCRTYGDYGSEEKTVVQIQHTNEQFERALERAENDASVVAEAAQGIPELGPLAADYAAAVAEHARLVELHRSQLADLLDGYSGYRARSRHFGSVITDQQSIKNRYQEIARRVALGAGVDGPDLRSSSTYQHVPPHFLRIEYRAAAVRVSDVLRKTP
jgi:hypothetical protein